MDTVEKAAEVAEDLDVTPFIKASCFSFGYAFGPGTILKAAGSDVEIHLTAVICNWAQDGAVSYFGMSLDASVQGWITEAEIQAGEAYEFVHEVLPGNIAR